MKFNYQANKIPDYWTIGPINGFSALAKGMKREKKIKVFLIRFGGCEFNLNWSNFKISEILQTVKNWSGY